MRGEIRLWLYVDREYLIERRIWLCSGNGVGGIFCVDERVWELVYKRNRGFREEYGEFIYFSSLIEVKEVYLGRNESICVE